MSLKKVISNKFLVVSKIAFIALFLIAQNIFSQGYI